MSRTAYYRGRADDLTERIAARIGRIGNMSKAAREAGISPRTASSWKEPGRLTQLRGVISLLLADGVSEEEAERMIRG